VVNPTAPASPIWHTIIDIQGQPYPTRNYAPDIEGGSDACLNLPAAQLDYLRAIHEAGHAVAALLGGAHLHSAEIVIGVTGDAAGGEVRACNLDDGHGFAVFSAAGERASDRWLREAGLWTPERAVANEVGARGDRRQFLAINAHVGFGDREVDYLIVHDLADQALDRHWKAVLQIADQLAQHGRLDAAQIVTIAGLTNGEASRKCEMRQANPWDETPAEAARYDRNHWNRDEDQ
jgi:hypothetical protein